MRFSHGFCPGKSLRIKCAQEKFCLIFGTFSGFRKHLNSKHAEQTEHETEINDSVASGFPAEDIPFEEPVESSSSSQVFPLPNSCIRDTCASAIAQLQVAGVSQSLDSFVSSMEEVVLDVQSQAKDAALKCLSSQDMSVRTKIEQSFESLENSFTSLNTESKRNSYYEQKWKIVEPVEKVLGVRLENRRNRTTGTYDQVVVTDKFTYVPILNTLQSILLNPNLSSMFSSDYIPKDGLYSDLKDGLYLKNHTLF